MLKLEKEKENNSMTCSGVGSGCGEGCDDDHGGEPLATGYYCSLQPGSAEPHASWRF